MYSIVGGIVIYGLSAIGAVSVAKRVTRWYLRAQANGPVLRP